MSIKTKAGALLQDRPPTKRRAKKLPPQQRLESPKGRKPANLEVDEKYATVFDKIPLANDGDLAAEQFVDEYLRDIDPIDLDAEGLEEHPLRVLAHNLTERCPEAIAGSDSVTEYFNIWGRRLHRSVAGRVVPLAILKLFSLSLSARRLQSLDTTSDLAKPDLDAGGPDQRVRNRRRLLMLQIIQEVEELQHEGLDPFVD